MLRLSFILLLFFSAQFACAQDTTVRARDMTHHSRDYKRIGLLLAANLGHYTYAELGLAGIHVAWYDQRASAIALSASSEIRIQNGQTIIGPKIAAWFTSATCGVGGVSTIYYTDFQTGSLVLRPEIGIGFAGIKATYGYNWQIVNYSFGGINRHLFSLTVCLDLIKLN